MRTFPTPSQFQFNLAGDFHLSGALHGGTLVTSTLLVYIANTMLIGTCPHHGNAYVSIKFMESSPSCDYMFAHATLRPGGPLNSKARSYRKAIRASEQRRCK